MIETNGFAERATLPLDPGAVAARDALREALHNLRVKVLEAEAYLGGAVVAPLADPLDALEHAGEEVDKWLRAIGYEVEGLRSSLRQLRDLAHEGEDTARERDRLEREVESVRDVQRQQAVIVRDFLNAELATADVSDVPSAHSDAYIRGARDLADTLGLLVAEHPLAQLFKEDAATLQARSNPQ